MATTCDGCRYWSALADETAAVGVCGNSKSGNFKTSTKPESGCAFWQHADGFWSTATRPARPIMEDGLKP